jgi:hypothetical protein
MRRFLALSLVCVLLTACVGDKGAPRFLCPQVASLRELDRMEDHGREQPLETTLVAVATMKKIEGSCTYQSDGVEVLFDLTMEAKKGPRLGGETANFPFFVSLVSPDDEVLSKETMTESFTFTEGKEQIEQIEPLRVFIPLSETEDASNYRVLLGFQLTPDQIEAVRAKEE